MNIFLTAEDRDDAIVH